jgi:hypothetical protein
MTGGGDRKFTTLKTPRQYPLVLLVRICWKQGRAMRSEEARWEVESWEHADTRYLHTLPAARSLD